ncbi:MAG: cytochrome C biogenesis protein CcsA [Sulfurovum sp.]|nr:MAG: cytochrome C biogenesis protein CcsA [Sulfurovum sp.]
MNIFKLASISLLASTLLLAENSLIDKAKTAGLQPIPADKAALMKLIDPNHTISEAKVALGKQLFFEPRLSKSSIISCNTCHNLGLGGVDGVPAAVGHHWTANPHHLNSPTVYNAVFFDKQFWDGRSPTLEDQAQGPMQANPEMAAPKALVEKRINSMPEYVKSFQNAYGKEVKINFETITATIGIFERTLVTPSRFDSFLNGDKEALNATEKEGLSVFIDKGCTSCHKGIALGGTMQTFPAVGKYSYANVGDFKGDKNGKVKVPTLRNIVQTAPYFHNGAIWSLKEAVQEMGKTQLGIKISEADSDKIVTFLKALTGKKPEIGYPQLPTSTERTPKPDFK